MSGGQASGLKRFVLWDYPRASWQYDVMVALILAFIFLTPREWFRDQPKASSMVMLPAQNGAQVYWIEPELLTGIPEAERRSKAEQMIHQRHGKRLRLHHLETIFDAEQDIKGFMAYMRP